MKSVVKGLNSAISPKKAAQGAAIGLGVLAGGAAIDAVLAILQNTEMIATILVSSGVSPLYVTMIAMGVAALARVALNAWKHRK